MQDPVRQRIRRARPDEFEELGELLVSAYSGLPGMPSVGEQPEYYERLRDVGARARNPAIQVWVAVDGEDRPLGCVDFIEDMRHYASGGSAGSVPDAAGIRLLAVHPERRGGGVGGALTRACVREAQALGKAGVILHTTRAMEAAWRMYERLGFERSPELDFMQGELEVFGFRLRLQARPGPEAEDFVFERPFR